MNRAASSGRVGGFVTHRLTKVTQAVLAMRDDGRIRNHARILDYGAGLHMRQTLRKDTSRP